MKSATSPPLNPVLFAALQARFGTVRTVIGWAIAVWQPTAWRAVPNG